MLCHISPPWRTIPQAFSALDYQDCFLIASIMASSSPIVTRPSMCRSAKSTRAAATSRSFHPAATARFATSAKAEWSAN